jgi:hypothetical protein
LKPAARILWVRFRLIQEALLTKLTLAGVLVLAGLAAARSNAPAQEAGEHVSVVELFTSQGCSSCPRADRLLQDLSQRPDLITLSFPVTYWDYLGWKDTLARPEYAERQREYANVQGDGQVYTPETVVNGARSCVGNNLEAIEAALKSTAADLRKDAVQLTVSRGPGRLIIEAGAAPAGSQRKSGKIWVASVRHSASVEIAHGENAGRVVTYTNVVRHLVQAGDWKGAPASYAVPLDEFPKDGDMFVVFLQTDTLGPIVGAVRING